MPKQALYTLQDKEFFYGLGAVFDALREQKINPILVGGVGVQANILSIMSQKGNKSIEQLANDNLLSRDIIRPTDDYDISFLCDDENRIMQAVSSLHGKEETKGEDIYRVEVTRNGLKRPKLKIESTGSNIEVMLNFSNEPKDLKRIDGKWYSHILDNAVDISLVYDGFGIKIKTAKPEHMVAAKIARFSARDKFDICALIDTMKINGREFNYDEVRKLTGFDYADRYTVFISDRLIRDEEIQKTYRR